MPRVELARAAVEDIDRLVTVLSLPNDTRERIRRSLAPLADYPLLGPELSGRWEGFRFLLGPWRWMILVYVIRTTRRPCRGRDGSRRAQVQEVLNGWSASIRTS